MFWVLNPSVRHYVPRQTLRSESDITIGVSQIVITGTIWRSATELGTNGAHLGQKFKRIIEGENCQKLKRIIEGKKMPEFKAHHRGEKKEKNLANAEHVLLV